MSKSGITKKLLSTLLPRFCQDFLGIIWDVSGGLFQVPRSNFCKKQDLFLEWSEMCLGGSRRVLGVPQTPLQNIKFSGIYLFLKHIYFVAYWYSICYYVACSFLWCFCLKFQLMELFVNIIWCFIISFHIITFFYLVR